MKKRKTGRVLFLLLGLVAVAGIALYSLYMLWEAPPDKSEAVPALSRTDEKSPSTRRADGVYTILLVGNDDGNGNTDTIMVGKLDTAQHRMELVSIPRDTLINSPWEVRKLNAVYWGSKFNGGDGITALRRQVERLTGFDVDCYAVVDLDVLVQAVDLMGGVWFDVPQAMDYDDPSQDLAIHLSPGRQLLNGEQAMGVCRYRSAYVTGDLGRIEMQHRFLEACAEQFISAGNIPNLGKVAELLARRTDTNLSTGNIAWLLHQALLCDKENICFYTAPVVTETVAGYSYVLLNLWPWLDLVNAHLNPYDLPIGYTDVDVVYRNEYGVACTATLQDESYYRREGPAPAVEPAPGTPVVTPEPTPSPEPTPEETPTIVFVEPDGSPSPAPEESAAP